MEIKAAELASSDSKVKITVNGDVEREKSWRMDSRLSTEPLRNQA